MGLLRAGLAISSSMISYHMSKLGVAELEKESRCIDPLVWCKTLASPTSVIESAKLCGRFRNGARASEFLFLSP